MVFICPECKATNFKTENDPPGCSCCGYRKTVGAIISDIKLTFPEPDFSNYCKICGLPFSVEGDFDPNSSATPITCNGHHSITFLGSNSSTCPS